MGCQASIPAVSASEPDCRLQTEDAVTISKSPDFENEPRSTTISVDANTLQRTMLDVSSTPERTVAQCGVRLSWLTKFAERVPADWSTMDVTYKIIVPETSAVGGRFVDSIPCDLVGLPDYFISHMWSNNFTDLVNLLRTELGAAAQSEGKDPVVWLDIFAVNQHPGAKMQHDLADLETVIGVAGKTVLVMDTSGKVLTRIWCLFEIWKTAAVKTVTGLQIVMTSDINIGQAEKIFHELDVAKAEATNAADRDRIMADIESAMGGQQLNYFIKNALKEHSAQELEHAKSIKVGSTSVALKLACLHSRLLMAFGMLQKASQNALRQLKATQDLR